MLSFQPKSSHIRGVQYDEATRRLSVEFHKGDVWHYEGVPHEAYVNFTRYRSAGEFFHGVIRRHYRGVKLDKAGRIG